MESFNILKGGAENQDFPDTPQGFCGGVLWFAGLFCETTYFGELKKSKFILKIFLTKVKHYCMKLNYSSTVKCKSPGNEWLELN